MVRQLDSATLAQTLTERVATIIDGDPVGPAIVRTRLPLAGASKRGAQPAGTPAITVDVHDVSLAVTATVSVDRGRDVARTTRDVCDAIRNQLYQLAPGEVLVLRVRVGYTAPRLSRWDMLHRTSSEGRAHHWMSAPPRKKGRPAMSGTDKIKHTAEELKGRAKEAAGKVTHNDRLAAEGKLDQGKAKVEKAADKAKDAAKEALDE